MNIIGYIRDSISGIFRKEATVDSTICGLGNRFDPTTGSMYYANRNEKAEAWLHSIGVYNYDICDGFVHVVGDVIIDIPLNMQLGRLPIQFGYVSGNFICRANDLESLVGCPSEVGGNFYCYGNKLTSLEGGPKEVGGDFNCENNMLTALEGGPTEVGGDFLCSYNFFNDDPTRDLDIHVGGVVLWL